MSKGRSHDPPVIHTERLELRPFRREDAEAVRTYAGDRLVSQYTLRIPHPYPEGEAESFIDKVLRRQIGDCDFFVIADRATGAFMGVVELHYNRTHEHATLGYWLAVPFWGKGYATEAARAMIRRAFEDCQMRRVFAEHFRDNVASGRVMQRAGMTYEGCMRQHLQRDGHFGDSCVYGILRDEWEAQKGAQGQKVASAAE